MYEFVASCVVIAIKFVFGVVFIISCLFLITFVIAILLRFRLKYKTWKEINERGQR